MSPGLPTDQDGSGSAGAPVREVFILRRRHG
jgi:hypothetical protein